MSIKKITFFGCGTKTVTPDAMVHGGKGASLLAMSALGMPVPPGFILHTNSNKSKSSKVSITAKDLNAAMQKLTKAMGYRPLVSVRSGAPVSMPGMMDTILNAGLTDKTLRLWVNKLGARAALDCYRRVYEMMGPILLGDDWCLGADKEPPPNTVVGLANRVDLYKESYPALAESDDGMLQKCIHSVFDSWYNARAKKYREIEGIPEDMGTAVVVQAMVFGNMGDTSGSGVCFTRNPATGASILTGEYLHCAQGEDVVSGSFTPLPIDQMKPLILSQLLGHCETLENHYKDMVDVEFTVQEGKIYMLQCRPGKRTGAAALRIARDLIEEGMVTPEEGVSLLTTSSVVNSSTQGVDPDFSADPHFTGLPASAGVAVGKVVLTSAEAEAHDGPCILVREHTNPDDIAGMQAAVGIITVFGGVTCHAAVVARSMNKPCITGVGLSLLDSATKGRTVTMDASTGKVWFDVTVPTTEGGEGALKMFLDVMTAPNEAIPGVVYEGRPIVVQLKDLVLATENPLGDGDCDKVAEGLDLLTKSLSTVTDPAERASVIIDARFTCSPDIAWWAPPNWQAEVEMALCSLLVSTSGLEGVTVIPSLS